MTLVVNLVASHTHRNVMIHPKYGQIIKKIIFSVFLVPSGVARVWAARGGPWVRRPRSP